VLTAPTGLQEIQVTNAGGSQAATGLGLVPAGADQATGTPVGSDSVITGFDVSGVEVEGVFTTLIRLQDAIRSGNNSEMQRLVAAIDDDMQRVSFSRGVVGTRQQNIVDLQTHVEDQQIQLKDVESTEIEADLASVISELSGRQAAMEASLRLMGTSSQLSLFDFI
jgi:flagellar hook-associated protein 3 FlgL